MRALILAGGFGVRLREVISDRPKILAPIKGKAFIDYLFYLLKKRGFTEVVLSLGYLSDFVKDYVNQRPLYNLSVIFSVENRPLGTAGAIKEAERFLQGGHFFVINGDTYLDVDYKKILNFHQEKKAGGTIVLAKNTYSKGWGQAILKRKGQVKWFGIKEEDATGFVNSGVYVFTDNIFSSLKKGYRSSIEKDLIPLLIKKKAFYGIKVKNSFLDIGTREGYLKAKSLLRR